MTNEHESATGEEGGGPVDRRRFLKQAAGAAAAGVVGAGAIGYIATTRGGGGGGGSLVAAYQAGELPLDDPNNKAWTARRAFVAEMLAQNITTPTQADVTVTELRVRALHNGKQLAFHLEWQDPSQDDRESIAAFKDAVAVQLEVDPAKTPAFTMGNVDAPVHILQWRASWQADIDSGRKSTRDLFPNGYNDVMPEQLIASKGTSAGLALSQDAKAQQQAMEQAKVFYPGLAAGNSMSLLERASPVEELTAIGFGSLTTHATQEALGKGVYEDGKWRVVIAVPMNNQDSSKARVEPGQSRNVAFAVWDGGQGQRGARKQYFPWQTLEIEAAK